MRELASEFEGRKLNKFRVQVFWACVISISYRQSSDSRQTSVVEKLLLPFRYCLVDVFI